MSGAPVSPPPDRIGAAESDPTWIGVTGEQEVSGLHPRPEPPAGPRAAGGEPWASRRIAELQVFCLLGAGWLGAWLLWAMWLDALLEPVPMITRARYELAAPFGLGWLGVAVSVYARLPAARWPVAADRPRRLVLALAAVGGLGWTMAPIVALRDRWARGRDWSSDEIEQAYDQLLRGPKHMGWFVFAWLGAALGASAVVAGLATELGVSAAVGTGALGLAIAAPTAALFADRARAVLRRECVTAPRPDYLRAHVPAGNGLRARLVAPTTVIALGSIATPLLGAWLHLGYASPGHQPAGGSWVLALFGGLACLSCSWLAVGFLASGVKRDVESASALLRATARGEPGTGRRIASFSTHEMRALLGAVERMVDRITDTNVATYVAIERAREADRLKSQFLANMSHDLRSPLNAIIGFSDLLLSGMDGELTSDQRETLKTIFEAGRELLAQIDESLDTAKIEAGRMELAPEPTPVATLVSRAVEELRRRTDDRFELDTRLDPGLPPAFVDPDRTPQALAHVLRFAQQQAPSEPIGLRAHAVDGEHGKMIALDTVVPGKPPSKEDLRALLSGFHRLPGHRGLGLGLPLAGAICELQRGSLDIRRVRDRTRLRMLLPAPETRRRH